MSLAAKLNMKEGQKARIVNMPKGLELELPKTTAASADAVLVFATNKAELAKHGAPAIEAAKADKLAWIAYPKAGQLDTDLNRDLLWKTLDGSGVRPVRQVSIDDVWSAMRFRPE